MCHEYRYGTQSAIGITVVGLLAAGDGRSSSALLRTDAFASSKIAPANLSSTHPAPPK
jgi:hypothetical protein